MTFDRCAHNASPSCPDTIHSMTKRVALISVHECPLAASEGKERGGINVYTFELGKALGAAGWQVDMYTRMQDTINPVIVQVTDRVRVIHLPAGPTATIPKQAVYNHLDEFADNLTSFIQHESLSYTAVHAHYYYSGLVVQTLKQDIWKNVPVFQTFHTLGLLKLLTQTADPMDDLSNRIAAEKSLITPDTHIIATSQHEVSYLKALYGASKDQITVIPPGVDTSLFRPMDKTEAKRRIGADDNHRIVLSVGRIDPVKGFDVLMYAFKLLFERQNELMRTTCLWIVGGDVNETRAAWNTEQKKLDALRHTLGLETAVQFVPAKAQEQLPSYYNAADMLVLPSHYESFGMVALEAIACGIPVVATDVTGISPIVKSFPRGHLISANNPILLSEKIEQILTHPSAKTPPKLSIKKLDWSHTAKQIGACYTAAMV